MLVFLLSTVQQSTILTQLDVDVAGRFHLVVQTAPIESAASPLVPHFSTPFHTVPRIKVPISSPANRQLSSAVAARAHTVHNLLPTYQQSPSWTAAPWPFCSCSSLLTSRPKATPLRPAAHPTSQRRCSGRRYLSRDATSAALTHANTHPARTSRASPDCCRCCQPAASRTRAQQISSTIV